MIPIKDNVQKILGFLFFAVTLIIRFTDVLLVKCFSKLCWKFI